MSPNLKAWSIGALNVLLSGAATAVGSLIAGTSLKQGAMIVAASAVMSFTKWFLQNPLPGGTQ